MTIQRQHAVYRKHELLFICVLLCSACASSEIDPPPTRGDCRADGCVEGLECREQEGAHLCLPPRAISFDRGGLPIDPQGDQGIEERCGDGLLQEEEGCDDGNQITESCAYGEESCQVCDENCVEAAGETARCGDGVINGPESCDDGNQETERCPSGGACEICNRDCQLEMIAAEPCGNGLLDPGEACDDGNQLRGDGCDGRCRQEPRCDANAEEGGCSADQLCVPDEGGVAAPAPSPGRCLNSDGCIPGQEEMSCGAGEFSCIRAGNISLCQSLTGLPEEAVVGEGGACDLRQTVCAAGLACEFGRCSPPCDASGRCAGEFQCLDLSETVSADTYRFCYDGCSLYEQSGCDQQSLCALVDSDGEQAIGACLPGDPGLHEGGEGEACIRGNGDPYYGDCRPDLLCSPLLEGRGAACYGVCDQANPNCTEATQGCVEVFDRIEGVGLCIGECSIFNNVGCERDARCILFGAAIPDPMGRVKLTGVCSEDGSLGMQETGSPCTAEPNNPFLSDCLPGHICLAPQAGQPEICIQLCQGEDQGGPGCNNSAACQVGLFMTLPTLGLCPP